VQAYVAKEVDHIVDEHVEWESQGFKHFLEYMNIKKVSGLLPDGQLAPIPRQLRGEGFWA
jgi:hypothetical protein